MISFLLIKSLNIHKLSFMPQLKNVINNQYHFMCIPFKDFCLPFPITLLCAKIGLTFSKIYSFVNFSQFKLLVLFELKILDHKFV